MSPGEKGKRTFLTFRRGFKGFPGWSGMKLYGEPSNLTPFVRQIQNGRAQQGGWARRLGYTVLNSAALHSSSAHFNWLSSVETDPLRIFAAAGGCTGVSSAGFSLTWFDTDSDPRLQRGTYYDTIDSLQLGLFDNRIYIGLSTLSPRSSDFRRYETVATPWGVDQLALAGPKQEYPIYTFAGRTIEWLEPFDNKLFISLADGAADNRVAVWDGITIYDGSTAAMPADRAAMANPVSCMGKTRDVLVAGYAAAADKISVREAGAVPGTWHDITPAAGTIQSYRMAEYRDELYIVPAGTGATATNIWVYNDTEPATYLPAAVTIAHTIANSEIVCCTVLGTTLYFGWRRTTDSHCIIGSYDGTTWTDVVKDISVQAPDSSSTPLLLVSIQDLIAHRGSLYAAVFASAGTDVTAGVYLVYSNGADIAGTWVVSNHNTVTGTPSPRSNDRQLYVSQSSGGVVRRLVEA